MRGKRYSAEERQALLCAYEKWPGGQVAFAKEYGVSVGTINRWQSTGGSSGEEAFIALEGPEVCSGWNALEVEVGMVKLRFGTLPEAGYLSGLLQKLGKCSG